MRTMKQEAAKLAPLACGHDVDRLIEVRVYPGGRRLHRCSVCSTQRQEDKR